MMPGAEYLGKLQRETGPLILARSTTIRNNLQSVFLNDNLGLSTLIPLYLRTCFSMKLFVINVYLIS